MKTRTAGGLDIPIALDGGIPRMAVVLVHGVEKMGIVADKGTKKMDALDL